MFEMKFPKWEKLEDGKDWLGGVWWEELSHVELFDSLSTTLILKKKKNKSLCNLLLMTYNVNTNILEAAGQNRTGLQEGSVHPCPVLHKVCSRRKMTHRS